MRGKVSFPMHGTVASQKKKLREKIEPNEILTGEEIVQREYLDTVLTNLQIQLQGMCTKHTQGI